MKYYLDADLSPVIAEILRKNGFDAVSVHDLNASGLSDEEHLTRAAETGRCLVSRNRDDFKNLTVGFFHELRPHAGVVIVPFSYPPDQFSRIAKALASHARSHPDGLPSYTFAFLPAPLDSVQRKRKKTSKA